MKVMERIHGWNVVNEEEEADARRKRSNNRR